MSDLYVELPGVLRDRATLTAVFGVGVDGAVLRDYARGMVKIRKADFSAVFGER